MRIAVVGAGGQLGSELVARLGERAIPLVRRELDISDAAACRRVIARSGAGAVINAAAYNLVDNAEASPEAAFAVNSIGAGHLAAACQAAGVPLVHVSSDYVFGAEECRTTPYRESDLPGPVNTYGVSKLAGEHLVRLHCRKHFVVRTCGLYGTAAGTKGNFVRTVLRLAAERERIEIVDDQRCTPTNVKDVAGAILALLESDSWGLYHVTNGGECTWYEFARAVIRLSGRECEVVPTTSAEFRRPASRPRYSVLDCSRLREETGHHLRPWQAALEDYLSQSPRDA